MPIFGIKERRTHRGCSRNCTYPLYSRGLKLSLFLLYHVCTSRSFWDIGWFFKISIFGHEIWNLKKRPKVAYVLFLPQGVEIKLIFAIREDVFEIRDQFSNFHYIWAWNLEFEERSQSCICTLFLPLGSKLSLFLLYRQPFSRYGVIFKIAIFEHETWNLKNSAGSCI